MTLFDGKPLGEEEVAAKMMCVCDHTGAVHYRGGGCHACDTEIAALVCQEPESCIGCEGDEVEPRCDGFAPKDVA